MKHLSTFSYFNLCTSSGKLAFKRDKENKFYDGQSAMFGLPPKKCIYLTSNVWHLWGSGTDMKLMYIPRDVKKIGPIRRPCRHSKKIFIEFPTSIILDPKSALCKHARPWFMNIIRIWSIMKKGLYVLGQEWGWGFEYCFIFRQVYPNSSLRYNVVWHHPFLLVLYPSQL